jgi:hypothetical protein
MFECAGGRYSSLVLERGGVWNEVVWFSKGVLAGNDGPFDFEMLLVCSSARIDHVVFAINLSRTFVPLISSPHENMPTRLGPTLAASRFGTTSRIKNGFRGTSLLLPSPPSDTVGFSMRQVGPLAGRSWHSFAF